MKMKLLITIFLFAMILALASCNKSAKSDKKPKEYDIEEFGKLFTDTGNMFAKECKYMTEDELDGQSACNLYKECAQKTGLPINEKVKIRGQKVSSPTGFMIESSDKKYHVPCIFKDDEKNLSLFIEDGENILVEGSIVNEVNNRGYLGDVAILSPENIEKTFEDNLSETLSTLEEDSRGIKIIHGEVSGVYSLEIFEDLMDATSVVNYAHNDNYYDTVVRLNNDESSVFFMYDTGAFGNLEMGDKVATQGLVQPLWTVTTADGDSRVLWGLMGNVQDLYIFD